jgi:hypothetical protein
MAAGSLQQAAGICYDQMHVQFLIGNLRTRLLIFCSAILPVFPESAPNGLPVANWAMVIDAASQAIPSPAVLINLSVTAQFMYKCLWQTDALEDLGLITTAQADAVLDAFNASFP